MKKTIKTAQTAHVEAFQLSGIGPAVKDTCKETFADATKKRKAYPLTSGAYKLHEARRALAEQLVTVRAIELIVAKKLQPQPDELLDGLCCLAGERNVWLRSLPSSIAWILGYYIVPAVGAMAGDGVSRGALARIIGIARAESERVVAACDEAVALINSSDEETDFAGRRGNSSIKELLFDALALADAALLRPQ